MGNVWRPPANCPTNTKKRPQTDCDPRQTNLSSMTFSSCCHNIVSKWQLLNLLQIKVTPGISAHLDNQSEKRQRIVGAWESEQWTMGPTAARCNNGHFRKSSLWSPTNLPLKDSFYLSYNIIIDNWCLNDMLPEKDHHYSFLQTVPKHVS